MSDKSHDDRMVGANALAELPLVFVILAVLVMLKLLFYPGRQGIWSGLYVLFMVAAFFSGLVGLVFARYSRRAGYEYVMSLTGMVISVYLFCTVGFLSDDGAVPRKALCQSNIKQIGLASFMYIQDWGDTWMPAQGWAGGNVLGSYIRKNGVLDCPSTSGTTSVQIDYEYNVHIAGTKSENFLKDPSKVLCMADGRPANRATDKAGTEFHYPHNSGLNVLFCDGHVKWVRKGRDSQAYSLCIK